MSNTRIVKEGDRYYPEYQQKSFWRSLGTWVRWKDQEYREWGPIEDLSFSNEEAAKLFIFNKKKEAEPPTVVWQSEE
jgi:hypothetical protein